MTMRLQPVKISHVMTSHLPAYVQAMLKPSAYPQPPASIELMQTQMSFVFLTGGYVYKTKKPVNLGYLDYTTLEMRRHFCMQELELNRRLCPGGYLDVLPITEDDGVFKVGGKGNIIEYAVKMKQLPQDRMMDLLLPKDQVTAEMLDRVAVKMADFHRRAATSEAISAFGAPEAIKVNTDENFSQAGKYTGTILPQHSLDTAMNFTNSFLADNAASLRQRAASGKIRDCHGDLHAAHICFADDIYIYDCIEFNDRFRYCDVANEIAFLAMDMDRYGRADLSDSFVQSYIRAGGDDGIASLLNFYKCYRAYVRGKVACFKYDDPLLKDKTAMMNEARLYFNLAYRYASKRPLLVIVTGLIGTGKTTMAHQLERGLGITVLSSDVIRKQMAEIPLTERRYDSYNGGLYSAEFTQKTYTELFRQGQDLLAQGKSVILDASFKKRDDRLAAARLARDCGADFLAVECVADEAVVRQRLDERQQQGAVSDGRWEIFADIKKEFDPVNEFPEKNVIIFDTVNPSSNTIASVLEKVTDL
ncbi:MAG: AAA family ATPase [Dehalococcoidia bacterium]|nr:AAA family ATPase [Dehalococcoidia bacterium]